MFEDSGIVSTERDAEIQDYVIEVSDRPKRAAAVQARDSSSDV